MHIKAETGEIIHMFIGRALEEAIKNKCQVLAEFNGVCIRVNPQSYQQDLLEKFSYKKELARLGYLIG